MAVSPAGTRDSIQGGMYLPGSDNSYSSSYKSFEGILALPLAEPSSASGMPVEIVRIHQPYRLRRVEFDYAKYNTPPFIPAPQDIVDGETVKQYLLDSELSFPLPPINADRSSLTWRGSGVLTYIENSPWSVASGYPIGDYPTSNITRVLSGSVDGSEISGSESAITQYYDVADKGEGIALSMTGFPNSDSYAGAVYNFQYHYPSQYLVADLAKGN